MALKLKKSAEIDVDRNFEKNELCWKNNCWIYSWLINFLSLLLLLLRDFSAEREKGEIISRRGLLFRAWFVFLLLFLLLLLLLLHCGCLATAPIQPPVKEKRELRPFGNAAGGWMMQKRGTKGGAYFMMPLWWSLHVWRSETFSSFFLSFFLSFFRFGTLISFLLRLWIRCVVFQFPFVLPNWGRKWKVGTERNSTQSSHKTFVHLR